METLKRIGTKLIFPHIAIVVILVPVATALLIYTLAFGSQYDMTAYVSYGLSAYALTIACVRVPRIIKGVKRIKKENRYVNQYVTNAHLRVKVSLYCLLAVNILYSFLQLVSGIYYHSIWFYALAVYYVLLALMRYYLLQDTLKMEPGKDMISELRRYRFCGIILLMVNLALSVIVTYIVWQNRGFAYNEILTIAMAAYTFLAMTMAIVNVIKYRQYKSPVMSATKAISLASALVSMLSLETAMLDAFGNGDSPVFRRIMTGATGAAVCVLVLAIAVYMIVSSTKQLKETKEGVKSDE